MASFTPGTAYCLVKSCPVGTQSFVQMVNAHAGAVSLDRPYTLVILPHQRQFSTLEPVAVVEELRSVLADEATLLDAATGSVWRLEIDSLTVLNTISKLGFRASQFDTNSEGVHTWTLSCSADQNNSEPDKLPNPNKKSTEQKRTLPANGTKNGIDTESDSGEDFDHSISGLSSNSACNSVANMRLRREQQNTMNGKLYNSSYGSRLSENKTIKQCTVASNEKFVLHDRPPAHVFADFLTTDTIPRETFAKYSSASLGKQSKLSRPDRVLCGCEPSKKTVSRTRDDCKSTATVAGRRYCHFVVDRVFYRMLKLNQKRGEFQLPRLCHTLLSSLYTVQELCCIAPWKHDAILGWTSDETLTQWVCMPNEHLSDIQFVLTEYWNAYVKHSTRAFAGGEAAVQRLMPTRDNVINAINRYVYYVRRHVHANEGKSSTSRIGVPNDDDDEYEAVMMSDGESCSFPVAVVERDDWVAAGNGNDDEDDIESELGELQNHSKRKRAAVDEADQKLSLPARNAYAAGALAALAAKRRAATLDSRAADKEARRQAKIEMLNAAPTSSSTNSSANEIEAITRKFLLHEAGPIHRPLYDFFSHPETMVPKQTLKKYWYVGSKHLQANRLSCICKTKFETECASNATVAGRQFCRYAVDRQFKNMLKNRPTFKTSYLCRKLLNSVYTTNELCCMCVEKNPEFYVQIPQTHLADIQHVMIEYWNSFVENSASSITLDKSFTAEMPTLNNITHIVSKLITDSRSKLLKEVREQALGGGGKDGGRRRKTNVNVDRDDDDE